jgi:tRNA(His) 5'-end guanylyltransferase
MKCDTIEDWCKWLEKNFSNEIMIPTLPVIIRLDGNNFSKYTKKLNKPFDDNFSNLMIETTKYLVKETNAVIGYTQSDEITLILYSEDRKSSLYNEGKKQKILSKLTAKCSNFFNQKRLELLPSINDMAVFDCRIYQTPTLQDACVQLLWRENDATRNSILMLAGDLFSHNSIQKLKTYELQDKMMLEKSVNWNNLDSKFKRGTYIKRIKTFKPYTNEELENLPLKHNARKNPNLIIERTKIEIVNFPIFNKIKNSVDVIFYDKKPIV